MATAVANLHSSAFLSSSKNHPSVLSDDIITKKGPESDAVLVFRLPESNKGRVQTTLRLPLTASVGEMKRQLLGLENFTDPESLELWHDGVVMEEGRTLLTYTETGFLGMIRVRGGHKEIRIATAGVDIVFPMKWSVAQTLTDILRCIVTRTKKLCGRMLDLTTIRLCMGGTTLPIEKCYRYPRQYLDNSQTLASLGVSQAGQPCSVKFRRLRNGEEVFYLLPLGGDSTVGDLEEAVVKQQREDAEKDADEGWVAGVLRPKAAGSIHRRVWDDEDETVSPCGVRRIYLFMPDSPQYCTSEGLNKGEPYFTFHPPSKEAPAFIDVDQDYSVPHLTDLGVIPGVVLEMSFYCPGIKAWSGSLEEAKQDDGSEEEITVKIENGSILRIPARLDEPFESIYYKVWCATGLPPFETTLITEQSIAIHRRDTLDSLGLLPESVLICKIGPT
eukprot:TRINITY_DN19888_c0_g3_i1.p1 TRINITY_DN19888_c0_g3~~TRINITY_DN19888_c0_g3_i1.p1  ORF type:complete len:445 (+),score=86.74 TRINITY_DN19888_c0_g3_i1:48-1382(+)